MRHIWNKSGIDLFIHFISSIKFSSLLLVNLFLSFCFVLKLHLGLYINTSTDFEIASLLLRQTLLPLPLLVIKYDRF